MWRNPKFHKHRNKKISFQHHSNLDEELKINFDKTEVKDNDSYDIAYNRDID
jgi:hypothetical protein